MAKKVEIDIIKIVLEQNDLDVRQRAQILEDLERIMLEQELAKEAKEPPVKKQFVIMVSDPEESLKGKDYTGWVLQIPESESPYIVTDKIIQSAHEFNSTPRGRQMPVKTVGESCESVPAKIFKELGVWVKSKSPLMVITTDNQIPAELCV